MQSASFIAFTTSGVVLQFVGFKYILFILVIFEYTISGIFSFSFTTIPFSSSAHISISSNVTGKTFPVIFKILFVLSIAFEKLLLLCAIVENKISLNFVPLKFSVLNL